MDLAWHAALAEKLVREQPLPVLREVCRRPGEPDGALNLRLVLAGWPVGMVCEALQPGSAAMIRSQTRNIVRELRKLGRTDAAGQPVQPNWDLLSMSLWRAVDKWVGDSTRDASFFARLWKKLRLLDSHIPLGVTLTEMTGSPNVGSVESPAFGTVSWDELRRYFPDVDESYLRSMASAYSVGSPSRSRRGGKATESCSARNSMASSSSSPRRARVRT